MLNSKEVGAESDADTPLLWVLREELKLRGTKFGCGIAQCGAYTVHIEGNPVRSCVTPESAVEGRFVIAIEALATRSFIAGVAGSSLIVSMDSLVSGCSSEQASQAL